MSTREDQIIKTRIDELPGNLKIEVLDYIEFLTQKRHKEVKKERFKFDWEGAISELKGKYSSVELQHKALEWR